PERIFLGATPAQADQALQSQLFIIAHDDLCPVGRFSVELHAVRLVTAGAQNGAPNRQDAGESLFIEPHAPVLDQAAKAVTKAEELHAVKTDGRLAHRADGGVEARAIPAGGENAYALGFAHVGNRASVISNSIGDRSWVISGL